MPNPTVGKPQTPWMDSTNPFAAAMRWIVCPVTDGLVVDHVGNALSRPLVMSEYGPFGHATPGAFTVNGLSDPVWTTVASSGYRKIIDKGYQTVTTPNTMFAIIRHTMRADSKPSTARVFRVCGYGHDNHPAGIYLRFNTDGTVNVGFNGGYSTTYPATPVVLEADHWYLIAVSASDANARTISVYDYTDQATDVTARAFTEASGFATWSTTYDDAVVGSFPGDLYLCGVIAQDWNPAVGPNTRFADFLANPCAVVRGTPSGGMMLGGAALVETTPTQIVVACARPQGAGPFTYQWHASGTYNFTPGAGTTIAGVTSAKLAYSGPLANKTTPTYFKCVQSDGVTTLTTSQVIGTLIRGYHRAGFIGDSTIIAMPANLGALAAARRWVMQHVELALAGTCAYSPTASLSWHPNTAQDPVNGQAGAYLLSDAIGFALANGVAYMHVQLGSNDAGASTSAANFKTYLSRIVNTIVAAGLKVILHQIPDRSSDLIGQYNTRIAELIDGVHVFPGDTGELYAMFDALPGLSFDGLHPTSTLTFAECYWYAIEGLLDPLPTPAAVAAAMWSDASSPKRTLT